MVSISVRLVIPRDRRLADTLAESYIQHLVPVHLGEGALLEHSHVLLRLVPVVLVLRYS